MTSKLFQVANLSALLCKHADISAHLSAELSIKLNNLASANSAIHTFYCNGFKNDYQDKYLNKLSSGNPTAANEYSEKIQTEGQAYFDKREKQIKGKLSKICKDYSLDIQTAGLSGLVWKIDSIREFYI